MTSKKIYVVGNIFQNLSNKDNILSFNQMTSELKSGHLGASVVSLEQGISERQCRELANLAKATFGDALTINSYFDSHKRCNGKLTHKNNDWNSLISDPIQIKDNQFSSLLMIDERCAELSDHVTGQHIQFMVLIEAARQMGNAVTEKYYSDNTKAYLAGKMDTEFKSFCYPFKTELIYTVVDQQMKAGGNGKMKVAIDFVQENKSVCQITLSFSILERKFISLLESASIKALAHYGQ